MSCCNSDCCQGRNCPKRRASSIVEALAGYGVVLCLCLAAACWLIVLAR